MSLVRIDDPDDPRVADYRSVRERDLVGRRGLFVAEGEGVVRALVSPHSRFSMVSALIAENRIERLRPWLDAASDGAPIYVAGQAVMNTVVGFDIHRGILALGTSVPTPVDQVLAGSGEDAAMLVICGLGNHDNVGGVFRNAAALGAHGVLLDDRCCDPLYRKAIRVSVGAVLRTPYAQGGSAHDLIDAVVAAGFQPLALSPSGETTLSQIRPGGRRALILGAEGPGLPDDILARCQTVAIPMSGGFDSLNVATTSAIALHQLTCA